VKVLDKKNYLSLSRLVRVTRQGILQEGRKQETVGQSSSVGKTGSIEQPQSLGEIGMIET